MIVYIHYSLSAQPVLSGLALGVTNNPAQNSLGTQAVHHIKSGRFDLLVNEKTIPVKETLNSDGMEQRVWGISYWALLFMLYPFTGIVLHDLYIMFLAASVFKFLSRSLWR